MRERCTAFSKERGDHECANEGYGFGNANGHGMSLKETKSKNHVPQTGIAAAAVSGISWNYVGSIASSLSSLAIGIVMARILGPKPFGQVIIAMTIYGFINLFVDGGFSQALIQKPELEAAEVRKTFTFQVGFGVCSTAFVYLVAPWIARWFHDASSVHVIRAMSLMITIQSLGLVSAALLRRAMRFKVIQYANLSSYLIGYLAVGIPLAFHGAGVWSIVFAYLTQCLVNSIALFAFARHSLLPIFALPERSTRTFGNLIVANNIVNWGHSNLDNVAVSHLGAMALGLYGRACNFAYQPVGAVVTGLQTVLLSSTARVQERKQLMHDVTLSLMGIAFGVLGCAYATFAMIPDTTIVGLYGDKWLGVIPLMLPMALAMPLYGVHCLLGPILCGLGKPELEFWPQAISCAVAAAAYFTAAHFSILSVAWTLLAIMLLRLGLIAGFTFRELRISWIRAGKMLAKRAAFSSAFAGVIWIADQAMRRLAVGAAPRLAVLACLSLLLLACAIWSASPLIFGRDAARFLLTYASHLPKRYAQQLRGQLASSETAAAGTTLL